LPLELFSQDPMTSPGLPRDVRLPYKVSKSKLENFPYLGFG